jgi:prophage regulatory protein
MEPHRHRVAQIWCLRMSALPGEAPLKILRLPQVCEVTGLCRSMIYQLEADLRFPKRVKIGIRAVGWLDNEVNAWLVLRIAASRSSPGIS